MGNVIEKMLRATGEFQEDEIVEAAEFVSKIEETVEKMLVFDVSISSLLGFKKKEE